MGRSVRDVAMHDRHVLLADHALLEGEAHAAQHLKAAREQHQARCRRVEPMHDERVRVHRLHTRLQAVLAVLATGGHGEQAGGFVDDEEVVVEIEDGGREGGHGEARS